MTNKPNAFVSVPREVLETVLAALAFYGESDVITGRIVDGKISHIDDDGDRARKALASLRATPQSPSTVDERVKK